MKEIFNQLRDSCPACKAKFGLFFLPYSDEDREKTKAFKLFQIVRAKIYGVQKQRSVQQNKWAHNMFKIVSKNTDDPEWNTPEKTKHRVKLAMKFFTDDVIVEGNKVYFELRSFAFDKMEHREATIKYEEAKLICAKKIKVNPEILEAKAKGEG